MTLVAAQRRWSVIELLSITWIAGPPSIHSFSKYYPKINIKFPNESSMLSTLVPPSRLQRDFLDTSATFKSHEHLTWPYSPFSAFISIMNFPINNHGKNLTFLFIYIIPTSVLSICICGSSAGTIRAVPDTELKVPGLAPVLIFLACYLFLFLTLFFLWMSHFLITDVVHNYRFNSFSGFIVSLISSK